MFSPRKTHKAKHSSLFILYTFQLAPPTYVSLNHSSLHAPVVSHSSLYHLLSDSEAVASSVVFESFYWKAFTSIASAPKASASSGKTTVHERHLLECAHQRCKQWQNNRPVKAPDLISLPNICTHPWFLTLHSLTHSQRLFKESQAVLSLKAFTGQLSYCWRHFLCYMSQDYLFNIQSA
ncbi:hypothetical protein CMV_009982 [Castanea mollissima]|uniref:Uncharacterized protein n=1 Tax=Castanea mollissima TaxID=60419 RepID=A0A8J4W128_9ROSI|nr:hypothetical protein CMV_009982 [Castanea mollissima]